MVAVTFGVGYNPSTKYFGYSDMTKILTIQTDRTQGGND